MCRGIGRDLSDKFDKTILKMETQTRIKVASGVHLSYVQEENKHDAFSGI